MLELKEVTWTTACRLDALIAGRGVCVLLDNNDHAALFLLPDGSLRAIGNVDPFANASVLSRGLVGGRDNEWVVFSPLKKQAFSLESGKCLDDATVSVSCYDVRVTNGIVEVGR